MDATLAAPRSDIDAFAASALKASGRFWFAVMLVGQTAFAFYIAIFYGTLAAGGDLAAWNKTIPHGYTPGEPVGNAALIGHLLFAALITMAGALQQIPAIRARFPKVHRWLGRGYMIAAILMGLSGVYLLLVRRVVGDLSQHFAMDINAALILLCAGMAWRQAVWRNFDSHRRWALRLFLVVSGVWFFRVGLMASFLIYGGPFGFDPKSFEGPFLTFLAMAQYALPLALLQLYLHAQKHGQAAGKLATAATIGAFTLLAGVGIFGAMMGMWMPRLTSLLAG